jgi:hypothetical protein
MKNLFILALVLFSIGCKKQSALNPVQNQAPTVTAVDDTIQIHVEFPASPEPMTFVIKINQVAQDSVVIPPGFTLIHSVMIVPDGDSVAITSDNSALMPYWYADSDSLGYLSPTGWYVNL